MMLSPHFTLAEMTITQQRGYDNTPNVEVVGRLERTALLLEEVRAHLGGKPIIVSSGYRSSAVNAAVGGVPDSAHINGRAADFICPAFGSPLEVCRAIEGSSILYDQLIYEYGGWTHIAWAEMPRLERWTYATGTPARPGIIE